MQPKRFDQKYFQIKFVGSNNQRYGTFISPTFVLNLISSSKNDLKGSVLGLAGFWLAGIVRVSCCEPHSQLQPHLEAQHLSLELGEEPEKVDNVPARAPF